MRAAFLLLALPVALAGCGSPQEDTLRAIYAGALDVSGTVPVVRGEHLEARVGDGAWGPAAELAADAAVLEGPRMAGPAPGGGGDAHRLPAVEATFDVRLREARRLGGLTAHWFVLDEGEAPGDLGRAQARLPGDGTFQATVTRPGPFHVTVVLTRSSVDATPQAVFEPLRGRLAAAWTATGEVQPATASVAGSPAPPAADLYATEVRPGALLAARTAFEGAFTGREGTDVDVGLYAPDGRPAACGSGPGAAPLGLPAAPDPGQTAASATARATVGGAWSVRVGAQEAECGGASAAHANAGPVPYRLVVTAE